MNSRVIPRPFTNCSSNDENFTITRSGYRSRSGCNWHRMLIVAGGQSPVGHGKLRLVRHRHQVRLAGIGVAEADARRGRLLMNPMPLAHQAQFFPRHHVAIPNSRARRLRAQRLRRQRHRLTVVHRHSVVPHVDERPEIAGITVRVQERNAAFRPGEQEPGLTQRNPGRSGVDAETDAQRPCRLKATSATTPLPAASRPRSPQNRCPRPVPIHR
jgi:hypothetical protein